MKSGFKIGGIFLAKSMFKKKSKKRHLAANNRFSLSNLRHYLIKTIITNLTNYDPQVKIKVSM